MSRLSYNKNYIKIYLWKTLRIISGILSMTIVIPIISSDANIYGVYTLCISIISFLQYTDLGFLRAGQKYASECYALDDLEGEIKMFGFVHFIMFLFLIVCVSIIFIFSFYPKIIIPDLEHSSIAIASNLFLILAISAPFIVLQRYALSVFTIRIQDYKYQKIDLGINILKIIGVYFFIQNDTINIVNYFVFIQLLNILTIIISFIYIKFLYQYNFKLVFSSFRFDREIFNKTKSLAIASILGTVCWVLFFQLDSIIISPLFGIKSVAVYAIPYFLLIFITNLYNTLFYPFLFRFNQLIATNNHDELSNFVNKIMEVSLPLFLIPVTILILLMKPLIISWVGTEYVNSVFLGQLLLLSLFFLFITMPFGYLALAMEKIKVLNINAMLGPLIFFAIIFIFKNYISILAVAVAKTITFFIKSIFLSYNIKIKKFNLISFITERMVSIILSLLTVFSLYYVSLFLLDDINQKGIISFIKVLGIGLFICLSSLFVYFIFNKKLQVFSKAILKNIFN